jgi:hypothetical protein
MMFLHSLQLGTAHAGQQQVTYFCCAQAVEWVDLEGGAGSPRLDHPLSAFISICTVSV